MTAQRSFLFSALFATIPLVSGILGLVYFVIAMADPPLTRPVAGLCQIAYKQTIGEAGHAGLAIAILVIGVFTLRGVFVLVRSSLRTREFARQVEAMQSVSAEVIERLTGETARATRVITVHSEDIFAVTVGLVRPHILLSSRLVEALEPEELEAVLRHELVHVERRDPLRSLMVDFFRAGLPFVPILGVLVRQFDLQKEIEADAAAVAAMGSRKPLASALYKVLLASPRTINAGVGFNPTEARIDALMGRAVDRFAWGASIRLLAASAGTLMAMSLAIFVIFSSPRVVVTHICGPAGL